MAASDKPKLFYFDGPGRAEVTRLVFVYTGNEFEDVRFSGDEWASKYKAESPFGMAPFYEEGGVKLGGSLAIARYVGEKFGLGGSTPLENAQLESYGDALADLGSKIYSIKFGPEDERAGCKEDFLKNAPGKLCCIDKQMKGKSGFLDKDTWPDLMVYSLCRGLTWLELDCVFKDCNKIKTCADSFAGNEKFKAYHAKHPPPKV